MRAAVLLPMGSARVIFIGYQQQKIKGIIHGKENARANH
jgi:hypothetical protein